MYSPIYYTKEIKILLLPKDEDDEKNVDAQNIGSIYELQGLSELHYYLQVEHVFTPVSYTHLYTD